MSSTGYLRLRYSTFYGYVDIPGYEIYPQSGSSKLQVLVPAPSNLIQVLGYGPTHFGEDILRGMILFYFRTTLNNAFYPSPSVHAETPNFIKMCSKYFLYDANATVPIIF